MHISLAAEKIFEIGHFAVTNSLLASVLASVLLILFAIFISKKISSRSSRIQAIVEEVYIFINDMAESVGGKRSREFVPLVLTFFFFILLSNWMGLLPGFGSIILEHVDSQGHHEKIPLLRGATADLNTTLALALISVFAIQFYGVARLKLSYFKKFIDLSSPINFFVGILEIISEIAKVISFSFRLFGNIFAGEVLLAVVIALVPVIAPLPFFGLEIFVGIIQALVFSMLTLVFIQMAVAGHGEEHHELATEKLVKTGKEVEHGY